MSFNFMMIIALLGSLAGYAAVQWGMAGAVAVIALSGILGIALRKSK